MTLPDVDDLDTLGGAFADYDNVEDPTTDLGAAFYNKNNANTAMMTQTAARAICTFVGGAVPADPGSGFVHAAVWGGSAPVKPVVANTGTGVYTVTWPASVNDELAVSHTVNLRRGHTAVEGGTPYITTTEITSANVATVRIFDATGTLSNGAGTFTVWVY